jgi:tetratricopeptide (TPR) repeat protein
VRRAGNALRITAQLIDALTDTHLWSEKYTGTLDDVFDIQEKVSRSIVDALEVELTPQEISRIKERPTEDIRTYECYLRATRDMQTLTESGVQRALRDLKNGLDIMGENADLYFGLGQAYIYTYDFGIEPTETTLESAEECAKKVVELEPTSPRSHLLLGMIERYRGSVIKAIRHFERGLAIDRDFRDILVWLPMCYAFHAGQPKPAVQLARRLLEIDPLTPLNHTLLGHALMMAEDLDGALAAFDRHQVLDPESIIPKTFVAFVLIRKNEHRQAFDVIDEITRKQYEDTMNRNFAEFLQFARFAVQKEGERAMATLSDRVRHYLWVDPDLPWLTAGLFAMMDEKDEALRWLERAIDRGWINYPLFAEQDPAFENIRGEARFQKLMERIKPLWEGFEVGIDVSGVSRPGDH